MHAVLDLIYDLRFRAASREILTGCMWLKQGSLIELGNRPGQRGWHC